MARAKLLLALVPAMTLFPGQLCTRPASGKVSNLKEIEDQVVEQLIVEIEHMIHSDFYINGMFTGESTWKDFVLPHGLVNLQGAIVPEVTIDENSVSVKYDVSSNKVLFDDGEMVTVTGRVKCELLTTKKNAACNSHIVEKVNALVTLPNGKVSAYEIQVGKPGERPPTLHLHKSKSFLNVKLKRSGSNRSIGETGTMRAKIQSRMTKDVVFLLPAYAAQAEAVDGALGTVQAVFPPHLDGCIAVKIGAAAVHDVKSARDHKSGTKYEGLKVCTESRKQQLRLVQQFCMADTQLKKSLNFMDDVCVDSDFSLDWLQFFSANPDAKFFSGASRRFMVKLCQGGRCNLLDADLCGTSTVSKGGENGTCLAGRNSLSGTLRNMLGKVILLHEVSTKRVKGLLGEAKLENWT